LALFWLLESSYLKRAACHQRQHWHLPYSKVGQPRNKSSIF
jgi:hypothetical protein